MPATQQKRWQPSIYMTSGNRILCLESNLQAVTYPRMLVTIFAVPQRKTCIVEQKAPHLHESNVVSIIR